MNKIAKYLLLLLLLTGVFNIISGVSPGRPEPYVPALPQNNQRTANDSATNNRYPVKKTQITSFEDISEKSPIDLRDPSNVKTEIEYDIKNNVYLFRTKIGDDEWITPFSMTQKEYNAYSLKQSMANYFRVKNNESVEKGATAEDYSLKDIRIALGPAEKIFGPGGIKIRPQGYVELSLGLKRTTNDNPTISERRRTNTIFDVDQKIQLSVNATVGDKMNFDLNYDTEATFDFDSKKMKLGYEGKEDEIVKYLEAGNVSLNTTNSLITGANSLFGIRADLQFGKLRVNTVVSQQESETKTVGSKGGVQTTTFEFKASDYDENRHFFLGHYFRDTYDDATARLPYVASPVNITRMEVWITNKRGNFDQARNIVAFADLAEYNNIKNDMWTRSSSSSPSASYPSNKNNNLFSTVSDTIAYPGSRDINRVSQVLPSITMGGKNMTIGQDFEKVESARLLSSSEYSYNAKLGYLSLNSTLQSDEVLGVAYEYRIGETTYQVGEFSSNVSPGSSSRSLFVKLLKPTSLSPTSYSWNLMMKNIYSLGAYNVQSDRFRLNVSYQSDTTGTYINYIPEGIIKDSLLLKVMKLDRLDSRLNVAVGKNGEKGDGIFDFIEGYTIKASNGRIIFPAAEPFGEHLRNKINNPSISEKYVYEDLYTSSKTEAKQNAEKDKFKISGSYKASSNNEIDLGATNVVAGSVKVTAGGVTLTEGSDYTVDYVSGKVTIINQNIIDAGTSVSATLENQSLFNMQRKTMLGLNLSYEFSKNFTIGSTFLHMYEKPLTTKASIGSEAIKNTLVGFNTSYRTQSQWLTNIIDKLPFVEATQPSQIAFTGEFAKMFPGHYKSEYAGGYSYLDDFETSRSRTSIRDPYAWALSSTPSSQFKNDITSPDTLAYGKNRALLAWYYIDPMFTRSSSSLTPSHIKNDKNQLSNHFVREVRVKELYPNRDAAYNETSTISTLNLSFYPEQRGPYNLDATNITSEGKLTNPQNRWGGMMRKIDSKDFESSNVEYIEFWLMDPFVYNDTAAVKNTGGKLYFNLGEISEDILKDGRKFYENGLPAIDDPTQYVTTAWGRVPTRQSTVYAFDKEAASLRAQDVGFNGLSTEQEFQHSTYKKYLQALRSQLSPTAITTMEADPFSPLNDPSGDNFHYFRGSDYDRDEVSILDRYKYINGTEGNTVGSGNESYSTSIRSTPDVEDIDQDYTLNETESFYQYKVDLDPDKMAVGNGYITEEKEVSVSLANGQTSTIKWYQFKIPVRDDNKEIFGNISGFTSIRFIRMFMTGFRQTTHLRFGSLDLVRGDWRVYTQSLQSEGVTEGNGTISVTSVNIEENSDKEPVNYVMPPGESRILDPGQPQLRQENEQSLAIQITDLESNKRRAVYKNVGYDLRRYKRIQMYTHAESMIGKDQVSKGELTVFLRLGTDYKNNYYEYEIPLTITPAGRYEESNSTDQLIVWPTENMFDFRLEILKNLKLKRNKEKRVAGSTVSFTSPFSDYDPEKPNNKITVIGNPSLSEVNVIMIGVRNNARNNRSGEVWVNELRLTDFDEEGGWAAQGNLNIAFSDLGTLQLTGRKETVGFGSIEQSLMERRSDDYYTYSIATNIDAGRFLPEKIKAVIPVYYTYTNETTTPKYDPLDQDVTLSESLSLVSSKAEKDSIKSLAQTKVTSNSFSISGAKLNIRSKTPMPYDPANFSFGYAQSKSETKDPTTVYDQIQTQSATFSYTYSPIMKTWKPFEKTKSKAPMSKYAKSLGFNYLPSNISINSNINRYYTETVVRDLESYTLGGNNSGNQYLSFSSNFYWDRDLSLTWDFMKNLKASIQTGTRAEIEEPFLQVNKRQNPDDYDQWKDEVERSLRHFGTPLSYKQTTNVTYELPFSNIPFLDWANTSTSYSSSYNWDKGATQEGIETGNTLNNSMTLSINNRFNMVNLYNKWAFLKKVNQKFNQTSARTMPARNATPRTPEGKRAPKKFEATITLTDSTTLVKHNLGTKNVEIIARREDDGKLYAVKFKKIDQNNIKITTKDSIKIKVDVRQGKDPEETTWYKIAQYSARGLMSVRSISVNYSHRNENSIYGFKPSIGDFFGQSSGMVPGMGFAFGLDGGEEFVDKWLDRDGIVTDYNSAVPAIFNKMEKFDLKAQLEPVKGLKIDLTAFREKNDQRTLSVTTSESSETSRLKTYGGSFSMSIISISSAFESVDAKNGYYSKTFEKFLNNRNTIANRLENKYTDIRYPNAGFIKEGNLGGGSLYDRDKGAVNKNSADVLIPAFIAAYTGKDVNNIALSPFMALTSMVPNWNITYDGFTTLPWFKEKFKSFKVMHGYTSRYQVGSYSSFSSWVSNDSDGFLGFIANSTSGTETIIPSSPFDIGSVSIIEQFNPLIGAEATMNNSLTLKARYNKGRTLNLNVTSYQIVESRSNELVIGAGYRISEFNRIIGLTSRSKTNFNSDLNITADISHKTTQALLRKIEEGYSQATSGVTITTLKMSADYAMSKMLTLRAYFDKVINNPLISSSAYPTSNTDFGISIRFNLTQ